MRFMVMVRATRDSESGKLPGRDLLEAMGKFNEEIAKAGVMLAGEGLQPSARGARLRFSAGKVAVTEGPHPNPKELIAGFWIIQVPSKAEAIAWMRRCPPPFGPDQDGELEIRQVYEAEDFGAEFTPELRAKEAHLRSRVAKGK